MGSAPHRLLQACAIAGLLCACAGEAERRDVVLVSIDTLRAEFFAKRRITP